MNKHPTEPSEAERRLKWHIGDNLRWLADQSDRPDYMPCGMLTGAFLLCVAERLGPDFATRTDSQSVPFDEQANQEGYPVAASLVQALDDIRTGLHSHCGSQPDCVYCRIFDHVNAAFGEAIGEPIADSQSTVIDLEKASWDVLCKAAGESKWIPPEYMANDWLADCARFLRTGEGITDSQSTDAVELLRRALDAGHEWVVDAANESKGEGDIVFINAMRDIKLIERAIASLTPSQSTDAVERYRAALEPFARHYELNDCDDRARDEVMEVPIGDLRDAHQALTPSQSDNGEA